MLSKIELVNLDCIVSDGYHNAFTDLYHNEKDGYLYCAYRKSYSHNIVPHGKIEIVRSKIDRKDGENFELYHTIASGGDDRDPKFFETDHYKFGVYFGTYIPRWSSPQVSPLQKYDLITHVSLKSTQGNAWTNIYQWYRIGYWIWSVLKIKDYYASSSYHFGDGNIEEAHSLNLLYSKDALSWEYDKLIFQEGIYPISEPALLYHNNELYVLARIENKRTILLKIDSAGLISRHYLHDEIHSPCVKIINGEIFISGRLYENKKSSVCLWRLHIDEKDKPLELITHFLSRGDCGYPGMVYHNDMLYISYYSQPQIIYDLEKRSNIPVESNIYLAKLRVKQ